MENKCENFTASNMCEDVVGSCEKTINYANAIYNKALDDLRNELKDHYTEYTVNCVLRDTDYYSYTTACNYLEEFIDEVTERLKEKEKDNND